MPIAKIMMLLNQAIVKRFKGGVSDQLDSDGFKMRGFAFQRRLLDLNNRDKTVAIFIMGAVNSWRQGDKAFPFQCEQDFPASHIFETAVGLHPIPFSAEDFGNLSTSLGPMLVNSSLDQLNLNLGDDSFSNGNGQHAHYISEKNRRRQQKMHGPKKNWRSGLLNENCCGFLG